MTFRSNLNILVLGNAANNPVTVGGGYGMVQSSFKMTPLWGLCDELGIERIPINEPVIRKCNQELRNCITYVGLPNTNGDGPYDSHVDQGPTREKNQHEIQEVVQYHLTGFTEKFFDYTFIFAGLESGEGGDRGDHNWIQEVFFYLEHFQNPGKVIGCVTAPGPITLHRMKKHAHSIVYSIMPGQQYTSGLMNIIFGRVNPSAKLAFTIPEEHNQ